MGDAGLSRRSFLSGTAAAATLAVGGGLLAACGSSGSGKGTSSGSTPGAASIFGGTPRRGGSLVFLTWSEIDGFDPSYNRWDQTGYIYARAVYDPLGAWDSSGKVRPYLAKGITPSPDHTQWSVTLRPGIVYHDGAPLDATALMTTVEKVLTSPLTGYAFTPVANVTAPDNMTVVFHMKQPWPHFDAYLADQQIAYPPSPNFWKNPARSRQPVGTGPFVFKEWNIGEHLVVTRNPHYWRPGLPYLDSLTFRPIADTQSETDTLLSGGAQAMYVGATDQTARFRTARDWFYFDDTHPSAPNYNPVMNCLLLNTASPPLDDVRLRRALAAATDQAKIIKVVGNGIGSPTNGPFATTSPYYVKDNGYPSYDPAGARRRVQEVTASRGKPAIQLATVTNPKDLEIIQLLQSMWQGVGVDVTLNQVEQSAYITNALLGHYQAQTWLAFGGLEFDEQYVWLHQKNALPPGSLALNFTRVKDQALSDALDQGRSTTDEATRTQAYQTVSKRMGALVPYLFMNSVLAPTVSSTKVHDIAGISLPDGGEAFRVGGTAWPASLWLA